MADARPNLRGGRRVRFLQRSPTSVFAGAIWLALVALFATSLETSRPDGPLDPGQVLILDVVGLSFGSVGALLIGRLPRNVIGWLLAWVGLAMGAGLAAGGLADQGLNVHPGSVPGALWFAWLSQWATSSVVVVVAGFLPLVYPTGHLPSRRWRPVIVLLAIAIVVTGTLNAFTPFSPGAYPPSIQNPLLFPDPITQLLSVANTACGVLGIPALGLILGSVIQRYRHASGVERLQFRWFAAAAALAIVAFGLSAATQGSPAGTVLGVVSGIAGPSALLATGLMPVAIGVAVLRYRLYDIDLVIRRTAVYIPLTGVLAGIYAASVGLLQRVFIAATGAQSDGAVILSTLLLAATFTPIKNALQAAVDRRFRDSGDIDRRLRAFTDAVAGALAAEPSRTLRAFLRVAVEATGAEGGAVYLATEGRAELIGAVSKPVDRSALTVPVRLGAGRSGTLVLGPHPSGRPYSARECEALAAAAARLTTALDPSPIIGSAPDHVEVVRESQAAISGAD